MKRVFGINSIVLLILISLLVGVENSPGSPPAAKVKPNNLVVTTLADSGPGSLREALALAGSGDTISFAVTGTIFLTSGELPVITSVQILGPGSDKLIVDQQTVESRVFEVSSNVVATISDLTIAGGNRSFCGDCAGGGVRNFGDLTLIRCVITRCSSDLAGGGIASRGPLTLTQCSVSNNIGSGGGGGIAAGALIMDSSTVNSNRTGEPGGAAGGGIAAGTAFLTNCTISGNIAAPGDGGGISAFNVQFESCTIFSNTAVSVEPHEVSHGGGVFANFIESHNTIIAGNIATNLTIPPPSEEPDISGTLISQGFNLIQDTSGAVITGNLQGNIIGEDPLLGPLQDNGGPVFTHALLDGSPAIDAGSLTDFPRVDARGVNRPQDGDGDHIFITDMGAYELEGKGGGRGLHLQLGKKGLKPD